MFKKTHKCLLDLKKFQYCVYCRGLPEANIGGNISMVIVNE